MASLADKALAKIQKGKGEPVKKADPSPLDDAMSEAWEAVKGDDRSAFSEAMRNAITIAVNSR